jgi:hypothetical protein
MQSGGNFQNLVLADLGELLEPYSYRSGTMTFGSCRKTVRTADAFRRTMRRIGYLRFLLPNPDPSDQDHPLGLLTHLR